ncbi:MAG: HEAT repeat domain-containing protein [Phycisphaerae bacterium]|nr:HEAT repeat domain-containing protein [Phycisphaerae bacterium]
MVFAGCASPRHFHANIQSESAGDRILAIRAAGEAKDLAAVPLIVDRLEDEDDGVRFFAILALERITGTRLGYDYAADFEQRTRSVERWREYVRQGHHRRSAREGLAKDSAGSDAVEGGTTSR